MGLDFGNKNATHGMSKAIYLEINEQLSPPLQTAVNDATGETKKKAQEALNEARECWKKLSFAIAKGVVTHIISNMEISGIKTKGKVRATVSGNTSTDDTGHVHSINLKGDQNNVEFEQSNPGTGLVE